MCLVPLCWQDYCCHYGSLWLPSSAKEEQRRQEYASLSLTAFSAPLTWLLTVLNVPMLSPQEQRRHHSAYAQLCRICVGGYMRCAAG